MTVQNDTLKRMLASATKLKNKEEKEVLEKNTTSDNYLPTVDLTESSPQELSINNNLSLEPEKPLTRSDVMGNLKVGDDVDFKSSPEEVKKAKRKVGRLVTGASAATPLLCKGSGCPFSTRCVSGTTEVLTPKGPVHIMNIVPGQIIYSFDTDFRIERDIVKELVVTEDQPLFEITLRSGLTLEATPDHPLVYVCPQTGETSFQSLTSGIGPLDTLLVTDDLSESLCDSFSHGDLYEDTIINITFIGLDTVYDLRVSKNQTFFTNNIASHNCPYYQMEPSAVIGKDCLREVQLVEIWTAKYLDELDVDTTSISEVHSVSRLVEIDIMNLRMTDYLAINDQNLMTEFITGVTEMGTISNLGPSVAFDLKERLEKQKLKILETFNNTREKKAKLLIDKDKNQKIASNMQVFEKLDRLARARVVSSEPSKDAEDTDYYDI